MKLTFLGTGTSFGIPVVGCSCPTCVSSDPRDRRTRHGALVETDEGRLLVDAPPELRLQLLQAGVGAIDALWLTHTHADHTAGLDDVRIFSARRGRPLPTFIAREHEADLTSRFSYIFDPGVVPPKGTSKPRLELMPFEAGDALEAIGRRILPLAVPHGPMTVYGFRAGGLGYVTDAKTLPDVVLEALSGVRVLVLNALWFGNPHPTHFNVEEAVTAAQRVGAERTFLVHLTHRVTHRELEERLPAGVEPAYDGLRIEVPDS
jgi:phosphoribosyl 1,2-cyclic phosphate phosphodiesterase